MEVSVASHELSYLFIPSEISKTSINIVFEASVNDKSAHFCDHYFL